MDLELFQEWNLGVQERGPKKENKKPVSVSSLHHDPVRMNENAFKAHQHRMSALTLQRFLSLHFPTNCSPVQTGTVRAGSTAPQLGAAGPRQTAGWKQLEPSESLEAPRAGDSHTCEAAGSAGQVQHSARRTGTRHTALPGPGCDATYRPRSRRCGLGTGTARLGTAPAQPHRAGPNSCAEQGIPSRTRCVREHRQNIGLIPRVNCFTFHMDTCA